jgi:hypothetical protein
MTSDDQYRKDNDDVRAEARFGNAGKACLSRCGRSKSCAAVGNDWVPYWGANYGSKHHLSTARPKGFDSRVLTP